MKEIKPKELQKMEGKKVFVRYCNLQNLLNYHISDKIEKIGYYANNMGWRADIYRISCDSETFYVVTGYAAPRFLKSCLNYNFCQKIDKEAAEIRKNTWSKDQEKEIAKFNLLVEKFANEYQNNIKK